MQAANLVMRFALELVMLGALSYSAYQLADSTIFKITLALVAPLLAAIVWGLFIAPKARFPVAYPFWVALQVVLFSLAAGGLALTGHTAAALVLAVLVLLNLLLMHLWKQYPQASPRLSS